MKRIKCRQLQDIESNISFFFKHLNGTLSVACLSFYIDDKITNITSLPTEFYLRISNSFRENGQKDKQTDKQTNMTDYTIVAEGTYNNSVPDCFILSSLIFIRVFSVLQMSASFLSHRLCTKIVCATCGSSLNKIILGC